MNREARRISRLPIRAAAVASMTMLAAAALTGAAGGSTAVGTTTNTNMAPADWYVPGEVLVRFADSASADAANASTGGTVLKTFQSVSNLQHIRVPTGVGVEEAIAAYEALPGVLYAQPNLIYKIDAPVYPNDPQFVNQWALNNTGQAGGMPDADIDAPEAWAHGTGKRAVAVGTLDTGVDYNHPDLAAATKPNTAECLGVAGADDDSNGYVDDCHGIDTIYMDSDPMDGQSHGTHTAGTIGAVGNNALGVTGVNWNVTIVACKSHDDDAGAGTSASIIECMQYMEIMKAQGLNIVATNNSYGGCTEACGYDQATYEAIKSNMQKNILFVASAGNDELDNDQIDKYPVGYFLPNVIGVAATDRFDNISSFSNFGNRSVLVGAPGTTVLSTTPNGAYGNKSGTSMAAPHVVGLAALLWSQGKGRGSFSLLKNLILAGGDPLPALSGRTVTGRRINAFGSTTCSNIAITAVLRPLDTAKAPVQIARMSILCARHNAGKATVTVTPGGAKVALLDGGTAGDIKRRDGIYTGVWAPFPCIPGNYTFAFSTGESVTSTVTC